MTIAMELFEVRIDETSNEQIIILREKHGQRLLPIVIGMFEAQSIHVKINNIPLPRPLTLCSTPSTAILPLKMRVPSAARLSSYSLAKWCE